MNPKLYYFVTIAFVLLSIAFSVFILSHLTPTITISIVGTLCGVLLSIPVSLALLYAIGYHLEYRASRDQDATQTETTHPVKIITPDSTLARASRDLTTRK